MDFPASEAGLRLGWLGRVGAVLVGVLGAVALLLASINVVLRSVAPHYAIEWGDEVQVYLVVWAICLALAAVTAADRHVKADLFIALLPQALRKAIVILGEALGFVMSVILAWLGLLITYESWDFGDVSTTTLRFPLWIYQAALPVGMGLMAIAYLLRLGQRIRAIFARA